MEQSNWPVLLAVGTGAFMSALDGSVVNATLPVIRQSFGSDIATIEWVVTIYLLVVSGLLLSSGRLGDLRGHKRVYVFGSGVFIAGSLLCGLAQNAGQLIAARGAGIGRRDAVCQLGGHPDDPLPAGTPRAGAGLAGHHDLPGL